jgi:hypothetical protein
MKTTANRTTRDMSLKTVIIAVLLTVSLGVGTAPVYADQGIAWQSLSQDEQTVLRKHQRDWPNKSRQEQTHLLQGARKYLALPPEKRKAVENKRDQYRDMSPEEREQLRKQYSKQKKYR